MKNPLSYLPSLLHRPQRKKIWLCATVVAALGLTACGGDGEKKDDDVPVALNCDDSIKASFKPDAVTTVLLVKLFNKGDPLLLSGAVASNTPAAANDLCLVKLNVGPGNPGPAGAPSTSPGIGIEVWLPAKTAWNGRLRAIGGGGWMGSQEGSITEIDLFLHATSDGRNAATIAGTEGAVAASTDTGHADPMASGSFAMRPDGSINTTLWKDFSERSIHELALKSKALATAYYGSPPKYAYYDGGSTGGRQGMKAAQANPADFDGILSAFPGINWTKFATADLYPQVVLHRDLMDKGVAIPTVEQLTRVSQAAIHACDVVGGEHLGFVLDPSQCRYDPTKDANVLCQGVTGAAGIEGLNMTSSCVNLAQAQAFNKIWYGMTADGSAPDPAIDNGSNVDLAANQLWYGLSRGTSLSALANPQAAMVIAAEQVALELQSPSIARPRFRNATGNGTDGWRELSYAQLSNAFNQGLLLQPQFADINTDKPDLSAFEARGGKLLHVHGLDDELISAHGSVHYYNRVVNQMGGLAKVQSFYRYYQIPGMGHATPNGSANPAATPPIPAIAQLYQVMTDWVEKGVAPDRIVVKSPPGSLTQISHPICPYPQKASFVSGDPKRAENYGCS